MLAAAAHSDNRLLHKLSDASYYRRAIERLHEKWSSRPHVNLYEMSPEGYHFAQAFFDRKRLAQALAQSVAGGKYPCSAVTRKEILIEGKIRVVYAPSLTDRIVHGAVAEMLAEDFYPLFHRQVYSYIAGRNRAQPVQALVCYLRQYRRAPVKERGVYILRCDVQSYGASIPVALMSPLWRQLEDFFLRAYGQSLMPEERTLLERLIRPSIVTEHGEYQSLYGIPDGLPISALLLNLYLAPLDEMLAAVPGGFYARYGDDMLFAHPDADIFFEAVSHMKTTLAELQLMLNDSKYRERFLNTAGRAVAQAKGSTHIDFLGFTIAFDGAVALKSKKTRALLRELSIRARATARAAAHLSFEERGVLVCRTLNEALDRRHPHAHAYASMLSLLADDRRQLKDIDYRLARIVQRALLKDDNVRNFRILPYRKIRQEWHLRSLAYARNR